jgi:translation initiation factor 2B subunit (eIF-2B alpha/beta/delta family)
MPYADVTTDQMMVKGRKDIKETEQGLIRANKIVEDTIQVATSTAETLNAQTEQLERTLDNLDKIEFSLKTAKRVIRDITRGLATDK